MFRKALRGVPRVLIPTLWLVMVTRLAQAETLEAPVGGQPVALGGRVACALPTGGWSLGAGPSEVRPPSSNEAIGLAVELPVAADRASCSTRATSLTLVALGESPTVDPDSVTLNVDAGTVELHGRNLRGVGLAWRGRSASGADVCREPRPSGATKRCTFSVGHELPASVDDTELFWLPPGGRRGPDVRVFDTNGKILDESVFRLRPSSIVVTKLVPDGAVVDLATGVGEVPLTHPEVVAGVTCTGATCSLSERALVVRGQASLVDSVTVHVSLAPRVAFKNEDRVETAPILRLSVAHCPMTVASGPPLRGVGSALTVVRLEGRCAEDLRALRFFEGSRKLEIVSTTLLEGQAFAVLRVGRITEPDFAITAVRSGGDDVAVAIAHTATRDRPDARAILEIPGLPRLAFVPSNRGAIVHVPSPGPGSRLALLPADGIYSVETRGQLTLVRGDDFSSGIITLRFGYRSDALPGALRDLDLAVLEEPVGRTIHEANIPAPLAGTLARPLPLAEVVCGAGTQRRQTLTAGETARVPWDLRDACRLIVHRERLSPDYGAQKLDLEIDVLDSSGAARGDARASQTLILRSGREPLEAWIHGIAQPFDRLVVRLSHVADENHYASAAEMLTTEPALKWTAIIGSGHARLYASPTIPTGLYRFGDADHTGLLSLNFGVISRLTWLDDEGHEGLLNLEGGVLVMGLANAESTTGQSLTQVGAVLGIGLGIPFANRSSITEAAINLHLWVEHDLATAASSHEGHPWALIFGPSISIGNVGTNL